MRGEKNPSAKRTPMSVGRKLVTFLLLVLLGALHVSQIAQVAKCLVSSFQGPSWKPEQD